MFTVRTNQGAAAARRMGVARCKHASIKCVFHVRDIFGDITDENDYVFWGAHRLASDDRKVN